MFKSQHTVNDFQIGDCVVPVNKSELTLVIIDILKDKKKIICRSASDIEGLVHDFFPQELEKESIVRPPNIFRSQSRYETN